MLTMITSGISTVMDWMGTVVSSLFSEAGALSDLAPLFVVGIAIAAIGAAVGLIKSMVWGS